MALMRALERSSLTTAALLNNGCKISPGVNYALCIRVHTDTVGKATSDMKSHWVKNETKKRPISPHLTIWRWELPMNCSLGHRVTGCAMATTLYMFGYGICLLPGDYAMYLNMIKDVNLGPVLITSAKFILAYPLAYHTLNGARHLGWDFGKGFDMGTIYKTGWSAVFGAVVVAALMTQL